MQKINQYRKFIAALITLGVVALNTFTGIAFDEGFAQDLTNMVLMLAGAVAVERIPNAPNAA